jgi:hypothetical protein
MVKKSVIRRWPIKQQHTMRTLSGSLQWIPGKTGFRALLTTIAILSAIFFPPASADIPDRGKVSLSGMYQVEASNDPMFPMDRNQEWFLDFGKGIHDGISSGKVAVSLRENPKVSVRIMVWQYNPRDRTLLIGNETAQGSGRAVARGVWGLGIDSGAIFLLRGECTIVLKRADPSDY